MKPFIGALAAVVLALPVTLPILIAGMAFRAAVLRDLWAWFVTPVIHIQAPAIWILMGLTLVVHQLNPHHEYMPADVSDEVLDNPMFRGVLSTGISWLLGWLIQVVAQ